MVFVGDLGASYAARLQIERASDGAVRFDGRQPVEQLADKRQLTHDALLLNSLLALALQILVRLVDALQHQVLHLLNILQTERNYVYMQNQTESTSNKQFNTFDVLLLFSYF